MKIKLALLSLMVLISASTKAQILISALFGDKLNSPKIEFGLEVGLNRSNFIQEDESAGLNTFNMGFYFHILIKNNSYLSTGLRVKSNVGAGGMPTYRIGDDEFDAVFQNGELSTKISCFYLPVLFQQRLWKIFILEGGFQAGLRTKAHDNFSVSDFGGEVNYELEVSEDFTRLDAGLIGGIGFKLSDRPKSMSIGAHYYYGLVNISTLPEDNIRNSSIYLTVRIPIGLGSAE
jgi:hypothetical protein